MTAMIASVVGRVLAFGRLNDGTPLLIASTPVSAVQPDGERPDHQQQQRRRARRRIRCAFAAVDGLRHAAR